MQWSLVWAIADEYPNPSHSWVSRTQNQMVPRRNAVLAKFRLDRRQSMKQGLTPLNF